MIAVGAQHIFDGRISHGEGVVLIENGRIAAIAGEPPPGVPFDEWDEEVILAPGYIDTQVNGGGGVLFNDEPNLDGLRAIAAAHARAGTTSFLPTLISGNRAAMRDAIAAVTEAMARPLPGIAGLHLEGPFLAEARRGIHPAAAITAPTEADLAMLSEPHGFPLLVTLAPEIAGEAAIRRLTAAGVSVFLGHTAATSAQVRAALDAGAVGFTHLFNAMSQIMPRDPGAVGTALADERASAGIIVDGHHVHALNIRIAKWMLGEDRLFLVSDAMATAGSALERFQLGGETITLRDGRLTGPDGTLAGAHLTMAEAVANLVRLTDVPWTEAVTMATATPARILGLTDRGQIAVGARADLVALDAELRVLATWQGGVRV